MKKRSLVADYLVYLAVRIFFCLVQMLSHERARRLAGLLALIAHRLNRRHRLVAHENLRLAFPNRPLQEYDRMVHGVYRHFCEMLVEMALLPRMMYPTNWRRYFHLPRHGASVDALTSGRPTLLVTAHLGNWEMGGFMVSMLGLRSAAIARPLDNPFLHDFLMHRFRRRHGQEIIAKHNEFNKIQDLLAHGGVLSTLGDQDAGQRGLFVDFFGRPASTHKAIALLALEYNAVLIVTAALRTGARFHYSCEVEEVIEPADYQGRPDAVAAITQRFTAATERLVRRAPEQYFWLHRRWKHQPRARTKKVA